MRLVSKTFVLTVLLQAYALNADATYKGCYKNKDGDRVDGHILDLTWAECQSKAQIEGIPAFGMEHPQGYSTPGNAQCLLFQSASQYTKMTRMSDSECESEGLYEGKRLGGAWRVAVYELSDQCVDTPGWENNRGYTCAGYASKGWCRDGDFAPHAVSTGGERYNYPARNCCVCGKVAGHYTHVRKECVDGMELATYYGKTITECSVLCDNNSNCVAFNFAPQHGSCLLKSDAKSVDCAGWGQPRWGKGQKYIGGGYSTKEKCYEKCLQQKNARACGWKQPHKDCWWFPETGYKAGNTDYAGQYKNHFMRDISFDLYVKTEVPTAEPTVEPTATPTDTPTSEPTSEPTAAPSVQPTATPTMKPTPEPTAEPTATPTSTPTAEPTAEPTAAPHGFIKHTRGENECPDLYEKVTSSEECRGACKALGWSRDTHGDRDGQSFYPYGCIENGLFCYWNSNPKNSKNGSRGVVCRLQVPTAEPTAEPTATPTITPTAEPTSDPTAAPSVQPTATPTSKPTFEPTAEPTFEPTAEPTATPTSTPTAEPTAEPTAAPSEQPTATPTIKPTPEPTAEPSEQPTATPTSTPTAEPTAAPIVCTAVKTAKECTRRTGNKCLWDGICFDPNSACAGLRYRQCKKVGVLETGGRCIWKRRKCIEVSGECDDFTNSRACRKSLKTHGIKCSWKKAKNVCKDA